MAVAPVVCLVCLPALAFAGTRGALLSVNPLCPPAVVQVRRRSGEFAALPAAAKRRRTGAEGGDARAQHGRAAPCALVSVSAADTGKVSTSSDNSKASRTTSAALPAARAAARGGRPSEAAGAAADKAALGFKPCVAPPSEASKADSSASEGDAGRRAVGPEREAGPASGSGGDSDGEGRSARSSRDVVRAAAPRRAAGECEGDSGDGGASGARLAAGAGGEPADCLGARACTAPARQVAAATC